LPYKSKPLFKVIDKEKPEKNYTSGNYYKSAGLSKKILEKK
jgi:hypothetical protein